MPKIDASAKDASDLECRVWDSKLQVLEEEDGLRVLTDELDAIVAFVVARRDANASGSLWTEFNGASHRSFVVIFSDDGSKQVIRFPKPGGIATNIRDEKVRNEVNFLTFVREKTTIPVPRVVSWGLTKDSPLGLGPFIITAYVEGVSLADFLKTPDSILPFQEDYQPRLSHAISDTTLDDIYEQIAGYMLQLSSLEFPAIGAISKDPVSNEWDVKDRPLTSNMNKLQTLVLDYRTTKFPTAPFTATKDYLKYLVDEHKTHIDKENIADPRKDADKRNSKYKPIDHSPSGETLVRRQMRELIDRYYPAEKKSFTPYIGDITPWNMLVDPQTGRITALLDFQFTNVLPAHFSQDPPWWLLLVDPNKFLYKVKFDQFVALYEHRMDQFLRAMQRVETKTRSQGRHSGPSLCGRRRKSWDDRRFWFNYGIRRSFDLEAVYWTALYEYTKGIQPERVAAADENEKCREMMERLNRKREKLERYHRLANAQELLDKKSTT